ncbi:hypothetical protein STPH1_0512 [Streptomyces sp. OM5714]|nr:hypothetical protein STPH1_0512 [Streptomyces sp. OM5714]
MLPSWPWVHDCLATDKGRGWYGYAAGAGTGSSDRCLKCGDHGAPCVARQALRPHGRGRGGAASTATLIRAVGARDTAIGMVMCLGRGPRVLQTASACRVAADLSDAVLFGRALTGRQRTEVAGFAAGWGTLCAVAAVGLRRPGGPAESAL